MFEPLTAVQVRKATTVKIPAGGWVLLGSPDESMAAQIARRAELVKDGNVNEDFSRLIIGRLQDTHTPTRFRTQAEQDAADKAAKETDKILTGHNDDARKRQKKLAKDQQDEADEAHAEKVAKLNEDNDAIRNQGLAVKAKATRVELLPAADELPANEFQAEVLNAMEQGDLLAIATKLVEAKRLPEMPKGSKAKLIKAILAVPPLAPAADELPAE